MSITFAGVLADRSTWQVENCSIAMVMDVIGTRSSMLMGSAFDAGLGDEADEHEERTVNAVEQTTAGTSPRGLAS